MNVQWLIPSAHELRAGYITNGELYVAHRRTMGGVRYSVVQDAKFGFNMVRVDWSPEESRLPYEERDTIMDSMRLLTEIKIEQRKENNEPTL